jgi:hypothetical protein
MNFNLRKEKKMTIYDELVARGLIAQVTDEEEIKELSKRVEKLEGNETIAKSYMKKGFVLLLVSLFLIPYLGSSYASDRKKKKKANRTNIRWKRNC